MSLVDKQQALSCLQTSVLPNDTNGEKILCEASQSDANSTMSLSMPHTSLTDHGILSSGHAIAMWKKASKLLENHKVVKAPDGNPKTRWVSSDKGSSPHVVTTSKCNPRRYMCDKQCVGWKAHNICAHCIASAEDNSELDQFLTWFASSKGKEGGLTSIVYHDTYKYAGLKKPPRRKYGDVSHLPVEHKVDRIPLSNLSNQSNIQLVAAQNDHSYAQSESFLNHHNTETSSKNAGEVVGATSIQQQASSSSDHTMAKVTETSLHRICKPVTMNTSASHMSKNTNSHITTTTSDKVIVSSFGNSPSAMNTVQVCSTAQNIGGLNITTSAQAVTPNGTCATVTAPIASLLSQISIPSLLQSLTSQISNQVTNATMSMQVKPATVKSNQPFVLVMLNNRIKKCSGCTMLFRDSNGFAPDYILCHQERDWYPQDGKWLLGKLQNKYYHLKKSCIIQRCQLYIFPADMIAFKCEGITAIPPSIKEILFCEFDVRV